MFRKLKAAEFFDINRPATFKIFTEGIKRESYRVAYNSSVGIKPLTETEKMKIEEDRLIREQQ